jgi:uncharacterized damage-inducible protein DinB
MGIMIDDLRYPAGRFTPVTPSDAVRQAAIEELAALPQRMRDGVAGLNDTQLDTPYRDGGWTVRQVVHHVPDSHMNAYIRFKLALTEDSPTIKAYDEAAWALIADSVETPIETSLTMLEALHRRWVILLESMQEPDFRRPLVHPERGPVTNDWLLQVYAWHGAHHVAHITGLREREGW